MARINRSPWCAHFSRIKGHITFAYLINNRVAEKLWHLQHKTAMFILCVRAHSGVSVCVHQGSSSSSPVMSPASGDIRKFSVFYAGSELYVME
jgi:hypothetical protein